MEFKILNQAGILCVAMEFKILDRAKFYASKFKKLKMRGKVPRHILFISC
jgi:hypothetical protein